MPHAELMLISGSIYRYQRLCLLMKNLGTSELTCTALRLLMLSDTSFIGRVDLMAED